MKPEVLHLSPTCSITTDTDTNGRWFITLYKGSTRFFRCAKAARKHLQLNAGLPSRVSFDSWIDSLNAADAERERKRQGAKVAEPLTSDALFKDEAPGLSQELLATGFGPEVFQDEDDPTTNTRMVI